ncbi:Hypothetical predicted protein, partial [Paramuricea clavata]
DLLVESELVASGSINGVINGKHYNRAIRTHKVMFEALTRVLFDMYMQSLPAESLEQISLFIETMAKTFSDEQFKDYGLSEEFQSIQNGFNIYVNEKPATKKNNGNVDGIHANDALHGIEANWTCQRQQKYGFSSSACDQVMEQTFNRDSKTKGGITGFTLNISAVQRWILAQSERGSITRQFYCK